MARKNEAGLKNTIEAIAAHTSPSRSLASEIRCAVAAYFHGNPFPIYRCPGGMVPMRDGSVLLGWPGGRRRAQDGPRFALGQPFRSMSGFDVRCQISQAAPP